MNRSGPSYQGQIARTCRRLRALTHRWCAACRDRSAESLLGLEAIDWLCIAVSSALALPLLAAFVAVAAQHRAAAAPQDSNALTIAGVLAGFLALQIATMIFAYQLDNDRDGDLDSLIQDIRKIDPSFAWLAISLGSVAGVLLLSVWPMNRLQPEFIDTVSILTAIVCIFGSVQCVAKSMINSPATRSTAIKSILRLRSHAARREELQEQERIQEVKSRLVQLGIAQIEVFEHYSRSSRLIAEAALSTDGKIGPVNHRSASELTSLIRRNDPSFQVCFLVTPVHPSGVNITLAAYRTETEADELHLAPQGARDDQQRRTTRLDCGRIESAILEVRLDRARLPLVCHREALENRLVALAGSVKQSAISSNWKRFRSRISTLEHFMIEWIVRKPQQHAPSQPKVTARHIRHNSLEVRILHELLPSAAQHAELKSEFSESIGDFLMSIYDCATRARDIENTDVLTLHIATFTADRLRLAATKGTELDFVSTLADRLLAPLGINQADSKSSALEFATNVVGGYLRIARTITNTGVAAGSGAFVRRIAAEYARRSRSRPVSNGPTDSDVECNILLYSLYILRAWNIRCEVARNETGFVAAVEREVKIGRFSLPPLHLAVEAFEFCLIDEFELFGEKTTIRTALHVDRWAPESESIFISGVPLATGADSSWLEFSKAWALASCPDTSTVPQNRPTRSSSRLRSVWNLDRLELQTREVLANLALVDPERVARFKDARRFIEQRIRIAEHQELVHAISSDVHPDLREILKHSIRETLIGQKLRFAPEPGRPEPDSPYIIEPIHLKFSRSASKVQLFDEADIAEIAQSIASDIMRRTERACISIILASASKIDREVQSPKSIGAAISDAIAQLKLRGFCPDICVVPSAATNDESFWVDSDGFHRPQGRRPDSITIDGVDVIGIELPKGSRAFAADSAQFVYYPPASEWSLEVDIAAMDPTPIRLIADRALKSLDPIPGQDIIKVQICLAVESWIVPLQSGAARAFVADA